METENWELALMDLKIEGNRARTSGAYDPRMLRALNRLEGQKRWLANRVFSFEATPFNLEVWRSVFPEAEVLDPSGTGSPPEVLEADWDLPSPRIPFAFRTPPRAHQSRALEKIGRLPAAGLFMDVGTGKSWTGISLMGQRWCANKIDQVLLIAKNGVHSQWVEEQLPEHMSGSVSWKAWSWRKGTKKSEREFEVLLAFDGLRVFSINIDALITKAGEAAVLRFLAKARQRTMIIVDESQDIKNLSASRTKAAMKFRHFCNFALIMTGTPIAKNVIDLFSQFKFLDERILGHRYMTSFRSRYCIMKQTDYGPKVVGHQNLDELYNKIDPYIFRITSPEALDLPPKVYDRMRFELRPEQLDLIDNLKKQFFSELPGTSEMVAVKNAAGLLTRIQQISCGFLPTEEGNIITLPNPRLEALCDVIDQREIGKIIIWCRFNHDVENVLAELRKRYPDWFAVDYYGKTSQVSREVNKQMFLDRGSTCRFLVASPEAAGTGLNLQGECRTNIYYSNSFNALARWQSEGRTWRDGTTGTVSYFDLIAKKSYDDKILRNLQEKKSVSDLTLDDFRHMFAMEV